MPKETKKEIPIEETISKGDAIVVDKGGNIARVYSFAVHGENYGEIAAGYAKKKGYSVRKA